MKPNDLIIGGKFPAALLQDLLDRITTANVNLGYCDDATTTEQLRHALNGNGHLLLLADQDKQLDEVADLCVRRGISFDRRRGEEFLCFRTGMAHPMPHDAGGEALY